MAWCLLLLRLGAFTLGETRVGGAPPAFTQESTPPGVPSHRLSLRLSSRFPSSLPLSFPLLPAPLLREGGRTQGAVPHGHLAYGPAPQSSTRRPGAVPGDVHRRPGASAPPGAGEG